jgi:hypothetical protein
VKWAANIGLFLGTEVAYVALLAAAVRAAPEIALTALLVAVAFTIPFLPIYLGVLAALPQRWTHRQLRASALAASPVLITPFVLFAFAGGFGVSLLIVALPGAMAYGALVRLPRTREEATTRISGRANPV